MLSIDHNENICDGTFEKCVFVALVLESEDWEIFLFSFPMALSASDLPVIYTLLTNSMSGDEGVRKPAEAALAQCETRAGFCSCLMVRHFYGFHCVSLSNGD